MCSICLESIKQRTVIDPCMHEFCQECITEWTKLKNTCPACRAVGKKLLCNIVGQCHGEEIAIDTTAHGESVTALDQAISNLSAQMNSLDVEIERIISEIHELLGSVE